MKKLPAIIGAFGVRNYVLGISSPGMKNILLLLLIPIMVFVSCEKKDPYEWLADDGRICVMGDHEVTIPAEGGTVVAYIISKSPWYLLGPNPQDIGLLSNERDTIYGTWYKAYKRQEDQYKTKFVVEVDKNDTGVARRVVFWFVYEKHGEDLDVYQEVE